MNVESYRVLEAVAWSERRTHDGPLPLKRIATATLGGDSNRAARALADLDVEGCVRTDTMGWQWGWLTDRGRARVARE